VNSPKQRKHIREAIAAGAVRKHLFNQHTKKLRDRVDLLRVMGLFR
jgi:hypothetical protein